MSNVWIITLVICVILFYIMVFAILRAGADDDRQSEKTIEIKFNEK